MRCPECNTPFEVGAKRNSWTACPHCEAAVWLGDDPDVAQAEPDREIAKPDLSSDSGERIEIDLSCPGLVNPSTGIALNRSGNLGIFRDLKVFVDGVQVGRLAHKQRKVFRVQPGSRAVHVSMDWCESDPCLIDVEEGQIVELRCGPGSSVGQFKLNTLKALFSPKQFFFVERVE